MQKCLSLRAGALKSDEHTNTWLEFTPEAIPAAPLCRREDNPIKRHDKSEGQRAQYVGKAFEDACTSRHARTTNECAIKDTRDYDVSFFPPPFHVVRIPFCSVAIGVPITFPPDIASSYVATAVDCGLSSGEQMCARKTRNYANLS